MNPFGKEVHEDQSNAERVIWNQLGNRQVLNCKFLRRQTIGPYIVDFLCMEPKLVIEIDGGHASDRQEHDVERSQYLSQLGFRLLRFWNRDILQETPIVIETIRLTILELTPPPQP